MLELDLELELGPTIPGSKFKMLRFKLYLLRNLRTCGGRRVQVPGPPGPGPACYACEHGKYIFKRASLAEPVEVRDT